MKSILSVFIFLMTLMHYSVAQTVMYVKPAGSGTAQGSSWDDALPGDSLQYAINTLAANGGGQVWVAAGTYLPTQDTAKNSQPEDERTKTFTLRSGVELYGGFAGTERSINERQRIDINNDSVVSGWELANVTLLSGDLQNDGDTTNNTYHVVMQRRYNASGIMLDGFSVKYGYAALTGKRGSQYEETNHGGGVFAFFCNIKNCNISSNHADYGGGGVYLSFTSIDSSYIVENNCGYAQSSCLGGGVLMNEQGFVRNSFIGYNTGRWGAAVFMNAGGQLLSCKVIYNKAIPYSGYSYAAVTSVSAYRGGSMINCLIANNKGLVTALKGSIVSSTILNNEQVMTSSTPNTLDQSDMVNCIYGDTLVYRTSTIKYSTVSKKVDDTLTNTVVDSVKKLFLGSHFETTLKTPGFNAGAPDVADLNLPEYDLAGKLRISYNRIDRGAFEYSSIRYVTLEGSPGVNTGTSWENAFPMDSLKSAIDAGYGEVWIAAGNYNLSDVALKEGVHIYGGFKGTEKRITERERADLDKNGTIEPWEFVNKTAFKSDSYMHILSSSNQSEVNGVGFSNNTTGVSFSKGLIINCRFEKNNTSGSCVQLTDSAEIRHCLIEKNSSSSSGGGITLKGKSRAIACTIKSNKTRNESYGGGVALDGTALLAESLISNNYNTGLYDKNGGGVYANGGTIRNCVITNNTTEGYGTRGGGVFVLDNSNTKIINTTICNNKAKGNSTQGDDLAIAVKAQVVNTIVGSPLFVRGLSPSNRMKYCALPAKVSDYGIDSIFVYKGMSELYEQFVNPTSFVGVANTAEDSAALNTANWHLKNTSWFINKGLSDNSIAQLPELDADQTTRIKYNQIDLGAYEKQIVKSEPSQLKMLSCQNDGNNTYAASFSWSLSKADRYLLFVKEGTAGRVQPVDGESYSANTVYGKGSNCNGWYCAYNGVDSSVAVTNLMSGTDYKAMLVTQNGLRITMYNADIASNVVQFATKRQQTISFKMPDTLYAGNSYTINAVSTSGLDVTVNSNAAEYVSIIGQRIIVNKAADRTMQMRFTAIQYGNTQFEKADSVTQRVIIAKSRQKITFPAIPTKKYGEGSFVPYATASSGLGITFTSSDNSVAWVYNNQIYIIKPGKAIITAKQNGNAIYTAADSVYQYLNVSYADQYINFPMFSDKVYGDADFIPAVTASSSLPVTLRSTDTSIVKIVDNQIHIVGVGTTSIVASQYGNEYYAYADSIERDLTVKPAKQLITFAPLANKTYGDDSFVPNVSVSSNQAVTFKSSDTSVAVIADGMIKIVGTGEVTITASQNGNALYEAAESVSRSFTVRKAPQYITAESQLSLQYGSKPFALQASSSSGLPVKFTINGTALGIKGDSISVNSAGIASVILTIDSNRNYLAAAPKTIFVNILPKTQTVSLSKFEAPITFADTTLDPQSASSEQLPVSLTSSDMSVAQIVNDTLIKIVGVGSCMITPVQSGTSSVSSAIGEAQRLVVVPAAQHISNLPEHLQTKVGAEALVLSATALQNCLVSYELLSGTSIELVENKIFVLEPGVSRVVARVSGYKNYRDTTDTCIVVVSAVNNLRMPSYTITRDTVINLQQLILTADTFTFTRINPSTKVLTDVKDSLATIFINPAEKSWMGVDTIWFVAKNNAIAADSLLLSIKVRRRPLVEQIGVVTVDSSTGKKCIVAWERSQNAGIVGYIIYRGGTSSKWDSIGYVSASEPGIFVDSAAQINVAKQAYQYRMVTVYPGNVRSDASAVHTTMHLQTGRNLQNVPQLLWTPYKGADVSMYIIYRENPVTHALDSIGSSILTSFTDIDAPAQTSRYRVAIRFANQIDPKRLKVDSGPFSQSLSNMSEASLVDLAESNTALGVSVYPNPATDAIKITVNEGVESVTLLAADGRAVKKIAGNNANTVDVIVSDLARGLYSVVVTTANNTKTIRVEVQ